MGYEQMNQRMRGNNPEILLFNHFEVNSGICTKSGLVRTLKKYYENQKEARASNYSIFDSTPTTFLVTTSRADDNNSMTNFISRFNEIEKSVARKERMPVKHCSENIWLVKPENMN